MSLNRGIYNKNVYDNANPHAAFNSLPPYIKQLWTIEQFIREYDKNKIYSD